MLQSTVDQRAASALASAGPTDGAAVGDVMKNGQR
jgi:hypothetical protein